MEEDELLYNKNNVIAKSEPVYNFVLKFIFGNNGVLIKFNQKITNCSGGLKS